jgi:manganese/zinc/iron transport system permease protein
MNGVASQGASWSEVLAILTFRGGFNTTVVLLGTALLGLAAGVVGVFALLRNRSLVADAVSHATLPGIGASFLLAGAFGLDGRSLPILLAGGLLAAVVGAWCIHLITAHSRLREDAAIGIVLSVFFGIGVVLLSYIQKAAPTGSAGLQALIFGQAATMRVPDVMLVGVLAVGAIIGVTAVAKELTLVCFNDAFARVDGWPVSILDQLIIGMVVLVTVAGLQAVGLLMIVAMLIIPPVSARLWTERVGRLVVLSALFGALCGYLGAAASASLPDLPAGGVIVLTAGCVFAGSLMFAPRRGMLASTARAFRLRLRIAGDHLLERAIESGGGRVGRHARRANGEPAGLERFVVLNLLSASGELHRERDGFAASASGMRRGERVKRNRALWEQYLLTYADIAPGHVDWTVDQVEHLLSPDIVDRLEQGLQDRGIVVPVNPVAAKDGGER